MRERDSPVEIFGERFEVDVGCIDMVVDVVKRFMSDIAVRDHHGVQAVLAGGVADVDDVLAPDGRLVVGEGEMRRVTLERRSTTCSGLSASELT